MSSDVSYFTPFSHTPICDSTSLPTRISLWSLILATYELRLFFAFLWHRRAILNFSFRNPPNTGEYGCSNREFRVFLNFLTDFRTQLTVTLLMVVVCKTAILTLHTVMSTYMWRNIMDDYVALWGSNATVPSSGCFKCNWLATIFCVCCKNSDQ